MVGALAQEPRRRSRARELAALEVAATAPSRDRRLHEIVDQLNAEGERQRSDPVASTNDDVDQPGAPAPTAVAANPPQQKSTSHPPTTRDTMKGPARGQRSLRRARTISTRRTMEVRSNDRCP